jgi:hypothetical protein
MKRVILFMALPIAIGIAIAGTALAQGQGKAKEKVKNAKATARSASSTPVDASQVPQVVQDAHNQKFQGATLTRWELKQATGKKEVQWYTALFTTSDGVKARSRYKADGTTISSSQYYGAAKAPEAIKSAAASRFSGYTLTGCEQISVPSKNKNFYRVKLRKGSTKVVTYMDETGAEITKEKAPAEVTDSDEEDEGN